MYTCNLNEASKFCTKEAKEDLSWYASNLTDRELNLITKRPVISILKSNLQGDTLISVNYRAEQVLVTDSLEHAGHIGTKEGTLELVRISKKWKVKSER